MKYTFVNPESEKQQTVNIDDAWIAKQCSLLRITKREAINMWLCDEGYITDDTVAELTAKAKINGAGMRATGSGKPRKKPERKPDQDKRHIVAALAYFLQEPETVDKIGRKLENVEVTNIERMIAFTLGDDRYELTLSKKRKPKN